MKYINTYTLLLVLIFMATMSVASDRGKAVLFETSQGVQFKVEPVAKGFGIPWAMAFLSPSEIIFTQRNGKISILYPGTGKTILLKASVPQMKHGGQGGLLDVAVPPGYTGGDWIYFTYSKCSFIKRL